MWIPVGNHCGTLTMKINIFDKLKYLLICQILNTDFQKPERQNAGPIINLKPQPSLSAQTAAHQSFTTGFVPDVAIIKDASLSRKTQRHNFACDGQIY